MPSKLGSRLRAETIGQIIYTISTSVLLVILARFLNAGNYGILFLTISIVQSVRVIAEWGIAKSLAKHLSELRIHTPSQVTNAIKFGAIVSVFSALLLGTLFHMFSENMSQLLDEPQATAYLEVGAIVLMGFALVKFFRLAFQGFEEIKHSALIYGLHGFLQLIFVCVLTFAGFGAIGALWGYAIASVITSSIGSILFYYVAYRPYKSNEEDIDWRLMTDIIRYAIPLTATRGANKIDGNIDTLLVGAILNPVAVAYYTLSKQIINFVERPAAIIGFTISPTIGSEQASGEGDQARHLYEKAISNIFILYLPAALGIILVSESMVELVFGSEYLGAVPVLQVLSIFAILQAVVHISGQVLDFLGRAKVRAYAKGLTATMNVLLTVILLPILGVVGAAWATVITHSIYTTINLYIVYNEIQFNTRILFLSLVKTGVVSLFMSVAVYLTLSLGNSPIIVLPAIGFGVLVWVVGAQLSGILDIKNIHTLYS